MGGKTSLRTTGPEQANRRGCNVEVREVYPGIVYQDANATVRAFAVQHGLWDQAFGYRFETARRTIVISGDTAPTEAVGSACDGCDVLLHEVYKPNGQELQMPHWKEYFRALVKQGLSSATVPLEENSIVTLVWK